jgi:hypothetical protein
VKWLDGLYGIANCSGTWIADKECALSNLPARTVFKRNFWARSMATERSLQFRTISHFAAGPVVDLPNALASVI